MFVSEYLCSQFIFSRGGFSSLMFLDTTGDWGCTIECSYPLMCPPSWKLTLHKRSCICLFSQATCLQWVPLITTLFLNHDGVMPLTRVTTALSLILYEEGYKSPMHIANLEFRGISTKCRKLKATTRKTLINTIEPQEIMSESPNYWSRLFESRFSEC